MKIKGKILALGLISALVLPTTLISAGEVETREAQDCKPYIYMYPSYANFGIFEDSSPMRPITEKQLDGEYSYIDGFDTIYTDSVHGYLKQGQLSVIAEAGENCASVSGWMYYYLNGQYRGKFET